MKAKLEELDEFLACVRLRAPAAVAVASGAALCVWLCVFAVQTRTVHVTKHVQTRRYAAAAPQPPPPEPPKPLDSPDKMLSKYDIHRGKYDIRTTASHGSSRVQRRRARRRQQRAATALSSTRIRNSRLKQHHGSSFHPETARQRASQQRSRQRQRAERLRSRAGYRSVSGLGATQPPAPGTTSGDETTTAAAAPPDAYVAGGSATARSAGVGAWDTSSARGDNLLNDYADDAVATTGNPPLDPSQPAPPDTEPQLQEQAEQAVASATRADGPTIDELGSDADDSGNRPTPRRKSSSECQADDQPGTTPTTVPVVGSLHVTTTATGNALPPIQEDNTLPTLDVTGASRLGSTSNDAVEVETVTRRHSGASFMSSARGRGSFMTTASSPASMSILPLGEVVRTPASKCSSSGDDISGDESPLTSSDSDEDPFAAALATARESLAPTTSRTGVSEWTDGGVEWQSDDEDGSTHVSPRTDFLLSMKHAGRRHRRDKRGTTAATWNAVTRSLEENIVPEHLGMHRRLPKLRDTGVLDMR